MGKTRGQAWYEKRRKFLAIPGVLDKLTSIADTHGFSVEDLVDLIGYESTFDSKATNKKSRAIGLIQFMPATAKDLGTTIASIKKMDILSQLDVVNKYFKRNHRKGTHPYLTVAYPKAGRMEPGTIIADSKSKMAKQNPGWVDSNGNITPESIKNFVTPNGVETHEPGVSPKRDPFDAAEDMRRAAEGHLGSRDNVNKILDTIDFSGSTVGTDFFDAIEEEVAYLLDNGDVAGSISANSDVEKVASKVIDDYDTSNLQREFDRTSHEVAGPEGEEAPGLSAAEGGYIQPNGRRSTFTRDEDLAAQDHTYKSLNIY